MLLMEASETVDEITIATCFGTCGPQPTNLALFAAALVLVAAALFLRRWRDMFSVAAAAFVVLLSVAAMDLAFYAPPGQVLAESLAGYSVVLAVAAAIHGVKRGLAWLFSRRAAAG